MRIKFEIGIRVLEAEVIEFEIVFQSSLSLIPSLSLLSSDLSIIYYFRESLFVFQSLERFFSLSIERGSLNRVIISMEEFPFSFVLKYISAFHLSSFPSYSLSPSFFLELFSPFELRFSFFRRSRRKKILEREKIQLFTQENVIFLLSIVGKTILVKTSRHGVLSPERARMERGRTLSDTRHNLQFGNCRCSGHAKPQFNYYTRVNWLAGSTVTRNGVQIDLGSPLSIDQCLPVSSKPARLDRNPLKRRNPAKRRKERSAL